MVKPERHNSFRMSVKILKSKFSARPVHGADGGLPKI